MIDQLNETSGTGYTGFSGKLSPIRPSTVKQRQYTSAKKSQSVLHQDDFNDRGEFDRSFHYVKNAS